MKIRLQFNFRLISKSNEKIQNRQGRYFLSPKFKEWEKAVKMSAVLQYRKKPLTGDIKLIIVAGFTNKRHTDGVNLFKGLTDSLQGILYTNDSQIKHSECIVLENEPRDSFVVIVEEVRCLNPQLT